MLKVNFPVLTFATLTRFDKARALEQIVPDTTLPAIRGRAVLVIWPSLLDLVIDRLQVGLTIKRWVL